MKAAEMILITRGMGFIGLNTARSLWPFQDDDPQAGDIREVPGVGRQQAEITLDRLRREPQVVDAHVRVSSRLSDLGGQRTEGLGRFDGDPQLGFSAQSAKSRRGSLLLEARPKQLQTEPDLGNVDGREKDGLLPGDGVNVSRSDRTAFNGDPEAGVDQPSHGFLSSDRRPCRPFRKAPMDADNASAVSSSSFRNRLPNTLSASTPVEARDMCRVLRLVQP